MNKENNKKILSAREQNVLAEYHYLESLVDFLTFMVSEKFHSVSGQVFNLDSRVTA